MKKVIVTGATGQDGSNMIDYLLNNTEHEIYAVTRINEKFCSNKTRLQYLSMDLSDGDYINNRINLLKPDYCFNFAAVNFYDEIWNNPIKTYEVNAMTVMRILEAIRIYAPNCRFFSAGSCEEFGIPIYSPQDLNHPKNPISPYAVSKVAASQIVKLYREKYNIYAVHAILYNHEGINRKEQFITRKITKGLAKIKKQMLNNEEITPLKVGNIHNKKDWSDSEDFIKAIWLMLNQDKPSDYLLSSDETHDIKEFIELACNYAEMSVIWKMDNNEYDTKLYYNDKIILEIDKNLYRPNEVNILCGNSTETRKKLNWKPTTTFEMLVKKMVEHDLNN